MKRFKTFYNIYSIQKRFVTIILIVVVLFFALLTRVFYLQILAGKSLQVLASEEWLRDLPLSSKRGEIYDVNGVSLATTVTSYDVYVRARSVLDPETLATIISDKLDLDYEGTYSKCTNKSQSEVLIKMQVDEETALSLTSYAGVYLSQNVQRVYPYSNLLTQVLGYCTIDNVGQAGLELYYNKYLKGVDGQSLTQTDAQGNELDNSLSYYIPSIEGANLTTTLDAQMQVILEQELNSVYEEYEASSASGIILDAKTGGILAMAIAPSFDLNDVPRDDVTTLQELTKNITVTDVYEPGSTFKLITLAAALNEGLTSLDETFYCSGHTTVDGETIKCWKTAGHGSQTLAEAFKNSCNCVFVNLALRLGVEKFYEYLEYFGLGEATGVDISGESSGILMSEESVRTVDLARIGFGHAIAVTELQMASVYAKITTGYSVTPHLLNSIWTEDTVLYEYKSTKSKVNLTSDTIKTINTLLANNINSEGNYTFVEGYDVGGKTGTSQKYDEDGKIASGKYVASFIGTYPASDPEYVILICVDEPSTGVYYGGVVAKPVAQKVLKRIFEVKAFSPTDASQLANSPSIEMPYVVGMSIAQASATLKKHGLNALFDGEGEYVIAQLPSQGTLLYLGEIVFLITN